MTLRTRFLLLLLLTTVLAVAMGVSAVVALSRVDRLEQESQAIHEQQLSTLSLQSDFLESIQLLHACLEGDPDARVRFDDLQAGIGTLLDELMSQTQEESALEALRALQGDQGRFTIVTGRTLAMKKDDQDERSQQVFRSWVDGTFAPGMHANVQELLGIFRERREDRGRSVQTAVRHTLLALLVGLVALAGVALTGLGLVRRWLLKPVQTLSLATREIGKGRFQGSIPITSADELGQLARAIEAMHQDLLQSQELLVKREQFAAMGEMTASVAHNLRNPLAAIRLSAQNAMLEIDPEHPAQALLVSVKETVDRMDRWLRSTLTSLRPIPLQPEPVDPRPILHDLVDAARDHAARRRITIPAFVSDDLPPIRADRNKLDQALLAILFNALDASPDGMEVTLTARHDARADQVQVEIRDQGSGMDERVQQKLFQPFFTTKDTGTGIGLYLAHRIILEHQGEIRVESQPGVGTCMTVCLPTASLEGS